MDSYDETLMCRTCLLNTHPLSIINDKLTGLLEQCLTIKIEVIPKPCYICANCKRVLNEWNSFKLRFLEVELILNKFRGAFRNNDEVIPKKELPYSEAEEDKFHSNNADFDENLNGSHEKIENSLDTKVTKALPVLKIVKKVRKNTASRKNVKRTIKRETIDVLTCKICEQEFRSHRTLLKHWRSDHKTHQVPFKCAKCRVDYCVESLYRKHTQLHEPAACETCHKPYTSRIRLQRHIAAVHVATPTACPHCKRLYKCAKHLRRHILTHTNGAPEKVLCMLCGVKVREILPHMRRCQLRKEQKTYACRFCKLELDTLIALHEHQKRLHDEDKIRESLTHECQVCGKKFSNSSNLYHHRRTHSVDKPFGCSVCEKTFKRKRELNTHMQTHSDIRPFPCEYCDRRFRQHSKLVLHHRIHTGEKPYSCDVCHAKFARLDALKSHKNKLHKCL